MYTPRHARGENAARCAGGKMPRAATMRCHFESQRVSACATSHARCHARDKRVAEVFQASHGPCAFVFLL